ncbi:MAG: hypothetical protein K6F58_02355 [Bacteroidales bacterium]|nr:hypothetical protein [Bacteroidales bacterium]
MKKTFKSALLILAFLAFAACGKEEKIVPEEKQDNIENPAENPSGPITLNLRLAPTRVTFTEDVDGSGNPVMKLTWEDGDKVRVFNAADHSVYEDFTLASGAGTENGVFAGDAPAGSSFDIQVIDKSGFAATAAQAQVADGDTSHLKLEAGKTGVSTLTHETPITLDNSSSVLAFKAKLPAGAAEHITSVVFEASDDVFNFGTPGNTLTINLGTQEDAGSDGILKVYANLLAGTGDIPAGTELYIKFNSDDPAHTVYTRYYKLSSAFDIQDGKYNELTMNCAHIDQHAGLPTDDGSNAEKAYLIADPYQLAAVNGLATGGQTTFFKMIADVDMTGVTHTPINDNSGYTQVVNFNGNNKTISNLGTCMFYVLKGSVYDFTLDHASVTARGILAEYIQGESNAVTNVTISNGTVNSASSNVGALVGQINSGSGTCATISNCAVTNTNVTGAGVVGGIIGYANDLIIMSGCSYSGGTVSASARYLGGAIGSTANKASVISDCHVENATVSTTCTDDTRCGGFVGQLQTSVQIKGCTVGTDAKKVIVNTVQPASGKVLNAGGFVGVNYGTITKNGDVRSKAYVNVTSANTQGQQINVGGFAGFHRGMIEYSDAEVDMSELQGQYIGGFSGYLPSSDSQADHCTLKGSVRGNNYTGGFFGVVDNALTITNCQVLEGTVVVGQSTAGGFAAQIKAGTFEDCSAHVDLQCRGGNDGGFVGALTGGTVQRCSSAGTLSQISSSNTVFGGFAGYVDGVDLTKCSSTVNITVGRSYIGGLIGELKSANTVSECFYNGTISSPTNVKGGLIGTVAAVAAVITNCYTAGELVGSSGTQVYGGIVGELKTGGSVTNCYSTMDMTHGGRAMGGIVGRACNGGWDVSTATNNTISKCIAWNPAITYDGTASSSASSGAIIGYTSFKNILNNCYRRYDMAYKNSNTAAGTTCQTSMVDQVDCDGTNWAINGNRPAGDTPAGTSADAQYQAPYYGVTAAAAATVSSLAQSLSWDSSVWDFNQDLPRLKWTL